MFSNRTVGIPLKKESPLMAKVFSVYYKFFSIKVFSSDSNVTYSFIEYERISSYKKIAMYYYLAYNIAIINIQLQRNANSIN